MTINPKQVNSYTLTFEEAPKFAFTTNYVPKEFNPSTVRRSIYVTMSDYYHQSTEENDYLETRTIKDDFGKDLFGPRYTDAEWNADINFIMQCVRFYLSVSTQSIKIEPKIDNIIFRKYMRDMSENFRDWAEGYFAEGSDNLDNFVVRQIAFEDYKRTSGVTKFSMQAFTKALKGFCYTCGYIDELNPDELKNPSGRIQKRVNDPLNPGKTKPVDMLYLRTVAEAERISRGEKTPQAPDETYLPFSTPQV